MERWSDLSRRFCDGKPAGQGTYSTVQGDIYQGDFNENRMHGEGTYQWSNGDKYSGTYLNGSVMVW